MELWIRSQDKEELVKISGTRIDYLRENEIIGYVEYDGSITLGIYATKERALEVLDEIQQQLVNKYYLTPKEKLTCTEKQKLMNIDQFNNKIDVVSTLEKMELKGVIYE